MHFIPSSLQYRQQKHVFRGSAGLQITKRSQSALMSLSVSFDTMYNEIKSGTGYRCSIIKLGEGLDYLISNQCKDFTSYSFKKATKRLFNTNIIWHLSMKMSLSEPIIL